jgi:hypothetical protein
MPQPDSAPFMTQDLAGAAAQPPKGADPRLRSATGRRFSLGTLIFAGGLTAALFGSRILLQEIQSQPDMIGFATINSIGIAWNNAMHLIGATIPDHLLHDAIRRAS